MSIPSIKELKATKQVPHRHVMRGWLEESNFTLRECQRGSSHIRCTSNEFPDIVFNIVRDADTLGSLMRFIDALVEIEKRREQKLKNQFDLAAQNIVTLLDQKIPADLEYRLTDSGNIVLTDRAYPQIGLTFSQQDVRLAENKVRELTGMKRDYTTMLSRLTCEYDMAPITFNNGIFDGRLTHAVYDHMPTEELSAYQENTEPGDALTQLYAYVDKIEDIDLEHACRKEDVLAQNHIKQILITSESRRGERHNHVLYEGNGGQKLSMMFTTYSNRRATYDGKTSRISRQELERMESALNIREVPAWQELKAA